MLSWLGKRLVDYQLSRLSAGDLRLTLWMDAPDVQMTFPGDTSWAVELQGRARAVAQEIHPRGHPDLGGRGDRQGLPVADDAVRTRP